MSSLHQRIHADLEGKITSGEWPPGHRVPFESELMAQYDCARMTVNKVMAGLAASGRILRRRRAGSFVAAPPVAGAVLRIPDLQADITARGAAYGYQLLSRRQLRRAGPAADFLRGLPVLALRCLHLADGAPFALEHRLINLAAAPGAAAVDFAVTPPGGWLLAQVPWSRAAHEIRAVNASAEVARLLALRPGAACLSLARRSWHEAVPVTYATQLFAGAGHYLTADFSK